MGVFAHAKAVALTCLSMYPFIELVNQLSSLDPGSFEACDKGCMFIRFIGNEDMPSTRLQHLHRPPPIDAATGNLPPSQNETTGGQLPVISLWEILFPRFVLVRNGSPFASFPLQESLTLRSCVFYITFVCQASVGYTAAGILELIGAPSAKQTFESPVCPGVNSTEHCEGSAMRRRIGNHLSNSASRHFYIGGIVAWGALKALHDVAILAGAGEALTLSFGGLSVLFQAVACVAAFLWCLGAAEVFTARDPERDCACYYQLPTLGMLLVLGTPVLLLQLVFNKMFAVSRSIQYGDYLYSAEYDVPYRQVRAMSPPGGDPIDTLVSATVMGQVAGVPPQALSFRDMARLGYVFWWCSLLFNKYVFKWMLLTICIAPLFVRAVSAAASGVGEASRAFALAVTLLVFAELACLALVLAKEIYPLIRKLRSFAYPGGLLEHLLTILPWFMVPFVMLPPLMRSWKGEGSSHVADPWSCAASGGYMFIAFARASAYKLVHPGMVSVKIRMLTPMPIGEESIETWQAFASEHPEFALAGHVEVASRALGECGSRSSSESGSKSDSSDDESRLASQTAEHLSRDRAWREELAKIREWLSDRDEPHSVAFEELRSLSVLPGREQLRDRR